MAKTTDAECPGCHETNFMMASLSDDIANSLDYGSGVIFVSCNACGDRLSITVAAEESRIPETDETADSATCPDCWADEILAVELPSDALLQLEEGYLLLDVTCMDCETEYTIQTTIESIRNT